MSPLALATTVLAATGVEIIFSRRSSVGVSSLAFSFAGFCVRSPEWPALNRRAGQRW
jgi:hypothetical protein